MLELVRVKQLTPYTVENQWYENGVAVDPGTVTVGITRADGTVLLAPGQATGGSGTGVRSFALTTAHTTLLDRLTITWATSLKGTDVSYVEVVGGFLFTIAELREEDPLGDTVAYPTAELARMRTVVEQSFERECHRAFVPRYAFERITTGYGMAYNLSVRGRPLRSIRSASVDGRALSAGDLATVVPRPSSFYWPQGWFTGWTYGDIRVGYEYGEDFPEGDVVEAAKLLAKNWLVKGPIDDRATSMSNDDGTFTMATPGLRGSRYGIPEVDAVVNGYGGTVLV